jgi:rhomboid family protein
LSFDIKCPNCAAPLIKEQLEEGIIFACEKCEGKLIGSAPLRRLGFSPEKLNELWAKVKFENVPDGPPCPHCNRAMKSSSIEFSNQAVITLDVCHLCQQVWFDPDEFEQVPYERIEPEPEEEMPLEFKEAIALVEIRKAEEEINAIYEAADNHSAQQHAAGVLGLPVESNIDKPSKRAWVTWTLCATLAICFILQITKFPDLPAQLGFIPAEWTRYAGLTLFSSFFIHANILHVLVNGYFLFIFGDNVEDKLGKVKYIALIAAATLSGDLLHSCFEPSQHLPLIGASGGIAGVIACYAVFFPNAEISFAFFNRYRFQHTWVKMKAPFWIIIFIGIQLFGMYNQPQQGSRVSFAAHLGGVIVGLVFAAIIRFNLLNKLNPQMGLNDFNNQTAASQTIEQREDYDSRRFDDSNYH